MAITLLLAAIFSVSWSATGFAAPREPSVPAGVEAYQLLANPGMEQAFVPYGPSLGAYACKVAEGWARFGDTDPKPCWMDARDFAAYAGTGWVESIEGATSQALVSADAYAAGIYQQVGGLTPGLPYGFTAAMTTVYQTSAGEPRPGHMAKQVGIDPTGGTDPNAPTVVWSEPGDQDRGWDLQRRTSAVAVSSTVTVFIRVIADDPGELPYLSQSWFDSTLLARTVTVLAESPVISSTPTFTVRWNIVEPAPGATVVAYDVQWMDEADGQWVDWLTEIPAAQTQAQFTGSLWHTYRFRARARQWYFPPLDIYLFSPYLPEAGVPTTVPGATVAKAYLPFISR